MNKNSRGCVNNARVNRFNVHVPR